MVAMNTPTLDGPWNSRYGFFAGAMAGLRRLLWAGFVVLGIIAAAATETPVESALPPPANLTAKSGGNSEIPLTWEASPGATNYTILVSTTQNDTKARRIPFEITGTSFDVTHLKNDTTYYFRVKALSPAGASGFSREVSATTRVTVQPLPDGIYTLAPRNAPQLRLQADGGTISVREKSTVAAQHWLLKSVSRATYKIAPVAVPDQALEAAGQSAAAGATVDVGSYHGLASQQWTLAFSNRGYRLTPASASGLALNASGEAAGAGVNQSTADGADAQAWIILPLPEGGPDGAPDPGTAYVPAGYKLVFSDEFNGDKIDATKWETLAPYSQPHLNDEIECYSPESVIVKDGFCILRAEKAPTNCGEKYPWRSGAITSRATFTHAYYEARIKVPQGAGLWPAFWTTSSKRWPPEWDFFEIQNMVGTLYQYMHPTKDARLTWVKGVMDSDSIYTTGEGMPNPYDGFVVYGAEVTPMGITMWINGRMSAQWEVSTDTTDPMWVNCELAVGGKWPGLPDDTTPRPADMVIDYIRVYQ
jgi:Glycosyl hydrolases family 16/Fibronectin type III domain